MAKNQVRLVVSYPNRARCDETLLTQSRLVLEWPCTNSVETERVFFSKLKEHDPFQRPSD